jgi:hypothetical protein
MIAWAWVRGFEGRYQISDTGIVWSCISDRPLTILDNGTGYAVVYLNPPGRNKKVKLVHRLVAESFIPSIGWEYPDVNHLDGNKRNNNVENLEWTDPLKNNRHAVATGLANAKGTRHWSNVLSETDVRAIRIELSKGRTLQSIANEFGTKYQNIWCIKRGKSWTWLK